MAGNGPINTSPVYATDEHVWIRARGDYETLTSSSEQLAFGNDGVIMAGSPWTMTSDSVDFMAQGVSAQHIFQLSGPRSVFPGGGRSFAADSVSPNTVVLRVIGKPLNYGQPPAPAGATSVTFVVNTFATMIEDASWDLKDRFAIDEMNPFRGSLWMYQGLEDRNRNLRAATVLQVLIKAFSAETRVNTGDFANKLSVYKKEYSEILDRIQVKWGPRGESSPPETLFSMKISR